MSVSLRRLAALCTGVMMLVLVLAESGFACAMPEMAASGPSAGASAMAGMAGMSDMAGTSSMADIAPSGTAPAPGDGEAPCRFPWAPAGCRDMAPCAPATLASAAWQPDGPPDGPEPQRAVSALMPASFGTPPELPPPRA